MLDQVQHNVTLDESQQLSLSELSDWKSEQLQVLPRTTRPCDRRSGNDDMELVALADFMSASVFADKLRKNKLRLR